MAVPSTNTKLSGIQTEFGGSNPISIDEYYSNGPLVPAAAPAPTDLFLKVDKYLLDNLEDQKI